MDCIGGERSTPGCVWWVGNEWCVVESGRCLCGVGPWVLAVLVWRQGACQFGSCQPNVQAQSKGLTSQHVAAVLQPADHILPPAVCACFS
jgi:hypothetical protein